MFFTMSSTSSKHKTSLTLHTNFTALLHHENAMKSPSASWKDWFRSRPSCVFLPLPIWSAKCFFNRKVFLTSGHGCPSELIQEVSSLFFLIVLLHPLDVLAPGTAEPSSSTGGGRSRQGGSDTDMIAQRTEIPFVNVNWTLGRIKSSELKCGFLGGEIRRKNFFQQISLGVDVFQPNPETKIQPMASEDPLVFTWRSDENFFFNRSPPLSFSFQVSDGFREKNKEDPTIYIPEIRRFSIRPEIRRFSNPKIRRFSCSQHQKNLAVTYNKIIQNKIQPNQTLANSHSAISISYYPSARKHEAATTSFLLTKFQQQKPKSCTMQVGNVEPTSYDCGLSPGQ